jgi:ABC-type sugar transport system ATPase subunit
MELTGKCKEDFEHVIIMDDPYKEITPEEKKKLLEYLDKLRKDKIIKNITKPNANIL